MLLIKNTIVNTLNYKICLITDIIDFMFIIIFYGKKIYFFETIKQDSENCTDLEKIEKKITEIKNLGKTTVYNLNCFTNNFYIENKSRSNYFANKHLIKYICDDNFISYNDLHINTLDILCCQNKKTIVTLDKNFTTKQNIKYKKVNTIVLISNRNFINTLIKILGN